LLEYFEFIELNKIKTIELQDAIEAGQTSLKVCDSLKIVLEAMKESNEIPVLELSAIGYIFLIETIFSSLPQLIFQTSLFYNQKYDSNDIVAGAKYMVQFLSIWFGIFLLCESSAKYVQCRFDKTFKSKRHICGYLKSSFLFYVLRILTNILFFSSRLLILTVSIKYFIIEIMSVISIHFFSYFFYFYLVFYKRNSIFSFQRLLFSLCIAFFKMFMFFEDFSNDVFSLLNNLIIWLVNVIFAFLVLFLKSQENQVWLMYFLIFYTFFSFLVGIIIEILVIKNFFKKTEVNQVAENVAEINVAENKIKKWWYSLKESKILETLREQEFYFFDDLISL